MHATIQTSTAPARSCCEQGRLSGQARPAHYCEARQRTIKIMDVRVEAPGLGKAGVEAELPVFGKALAPELQAGGHHLDVALAQGIVHHILILLHLQAWRLTLGPQMATHVCCTRGTLHVGRLATGDSSPK